MDAQPGGEGMGGLRPPRTISDLLPVTPCRAPSTPRAQTGDNPVCWPPWAHLCSFKENRNVNDAFWKHHLHHCSLLKHLGLGGICPPLLLRGGSASPKLRALRFRERKRTLRSPAVVSAICTHVSPVTGLSTAVTLHFFFFQLNRICERFYLHSQFSNKTRAQISSLLYFALQSSQHSSDFQSDPATAFILFTCSLRSRVFLG